jgi:hypothetical protein
MVSAVDVLGASPLQAAIVPAASHRNEVCLSNFFKNAFSVFQLARKLVGSNQNHLAHTNADLD